MFDERQRFFTGFMLMLCLISLQVVDGLAPLEDRATMQVGPHTQQFLLGQMTLLLAQSVRTQVVTLVTVMIIQMQ